jgi:hypothetical protein
VHGIFSKTRKGCGHLLGKLINVGQFSHFNCFLRMRLTSKLQSVELSYYIIKRETITTNYGSCSLERMYTYFLVIPSGENCTTFILFFRSYFTKHNFYIYFEGKHTFILIPLFNCSAILKCIFFVY